MVKMQSYGIFFMSMYTALDAVQGKIYLRRVALKNPEKEEKNKQIAESQKLLHHQGFLPIGKKTEENEFIDSTHNLYYNVAGDAGNELSGRELQGRERKRLEFYSETRREGEEDASFWERELRSSGMRFRRLDTGVVYVKDSILSKKHQGNRSRRPEVSKERDEGSNDSYWERELQESGMRRLDLDEKGEYILDQARHALKADYSVAIHKRLGVEDDLFFKEGGIQGGDKERGGINFNEGEYSEFWERELQQS